MKISDGDVFTIISDYSNKLFRVRYKHLEVNNHYFICNISDFVDIQARDSSRDEETTQEEIVRERAHTVNIKMN